MAFRLEPVVISSGEELGAIQISRALKSRPQLETIARLVRGECIGRGGLIQVDVDRQTLARMQGDRARLRGQELVGVRPADPELMQQLPQAVTCLRLR